jgi:hypothetical protein
MIRGCIYDGYVGCATLTLRGLEEEGGYEWASYNKDGEEHHVQSGVLYQPLSAEAADEGKIQGSSIIPLCEAGTEAPCARPVPCGHCKGAPESECNRTGQHMEMKNKWWIAPPSYIYDASETRNIDSEKPPKKSPPNSPPKQPRKQQPPQPQQDHKTQAKKDPGKNGGKKKAGTKASLITRARTGSRRQAKKQGSLKNKERASGQVFRR